MIERKNVGFCGFYTTWLFLKLTESGKIVEMFIWCEIFIKIKINLKTGIPTGSF